MRTNGPECPAQRVCFWVSLQYRGPRHVNCPNALCRFGWRQIKANNVCKPWPSVQSSTRVIILQSQSVRMGAVRHTRCQSELQGPRGAGVEDNEATCSTLCDPQSDVTVPCVIKLGWAPVEEWFEFERKGAECTTASFVFSSWTFCRIGPRTPRKKEPQHIWCPRIPLSTVTHLSTSILSVPTGRLKGTLNLPLSCRSQGQIGLGSTSNNNCNFLKPSVHKVIGRDEDLSSLSSKGNTINAVLERPCNITFNSFLQHGHLDQLINTFWFPEWSRQNVSW